MRTGAMYAEHQNAMYNPDFVRRVLERRQRENEQRRRAEDAARLAEMRAEAQRLSERIEKVLAERKAERERLLDAERASIKDIIAHVAAKHGMYPHDLTAAGGRVQKIMEARIEAIVLVNKLRPELSSTKLGQVFNRDHSTILQILKKYGRAEKSDLQEAASCA